jgi:uncharacterized membrane protein YeiH
VRRRLGFGAGNPVAAADLAGTFLFALEGAMTAIQAHLDILGVLVIGFVAALGGGILRDVLIGATPPAAIRDQRYPATTVAGAVTAMLALPVLRGLPPLPLIVLDAAGLSLFAVAGTQKALAFGLRPVGAVMLGTLTAVGGGAIRDILLAHVPVVLHSDFYATAAIIGCSALLAARHLGLSPRAAGITGGLVCFGARLAGVFGQWSLPALV